MRASFGGLCLVALACPAKADEARRRFLIPSKPYAEALIDLAVQANVSLLGASACGQGPAPRLAGAYTLEGALGRLLAGAPCAYRIVDAQTVRITPLPAAGPAKRASVSAPLVTEVMITARRRPERLDALPAGVSVLSGAELRASGADDVRDTAGLLVGVLMTNLGPGRDKLIMRGLSDGAFTGRARSTISTYLDEAPINYNAPDPDLRLSDVRQVETVRGPQGALYGSGALAGVYRIVTNKPDPSLYSAGFQAIGASTVGGDNSYEADGHVNLPLAEGRAALRLVAYLDEQGGYLDNVSLRLSNVDSTRRAGGRGALRIALNDRWTLDVSAVGQHLHSRDTQYTTLTANPTKRANQVREASNNDFVQAAMTLHGELGWADLVSSTSYVKHAYGSVYDATAKAKDFSGSGAGLGIYSEAARTRRLVQDVVLTSTGPGPVSWLAGAYGSLSVERTPSSLDVSPGATALQPGPVPVGMAPYAGALSRVYDERRRDRLHEVALYGEGSWRFAPGWTVVVGGRAFETALRARADIVGAPPAQSRAIDEGRSFGGIAAKLSLQYQFDGGALLYGLYSDGFRPGGINSTGFLTIKPSRATFAPDRLRNFEFGAKARLLDRRLMLRAAAFLDLWSNIQSDQYRIPSGLAYTANVGDARIQGLETEAAYDFGMGFSLQAQALFSAPKITRSNPDFANYLGSGLPGAPKVTAGLFARYDRPLSDTLTLRLAAEANYVGPARLTFDPALSARTDPLVNAELVGEIATRRWRFGAFISNPANSSSNTFAYGNPFTFGQVRQVTPQRPRTIGLRLAAAF